MVALTRTLGKTTVGVSHKCICPSWAETEMVLGAKMDTEEEKSGLQKSIKVCESVCCLQHLQAT